MDGWNTIVSFWDGLFSGAMLVLGRVAIIGNDDDDSIGGMMPSLLHFPAVSRRHKDTIDETILFGTFGGGGLCRMLLLMQVSTTGVPVKASGISMGVMFL